MILIFNLFNKYLKILIEYITSYLIFFKYNDVTDDNIIDDNIIDNFTDNFTDNNIIDNNIIKDIVDNIINDVINDNITNDNIINLLKNELYNKELNNKNIDNGKNKSKYKIGLLTNEIPPIIYGGVATWIVNFIKMFSKSDIFEVVPIFLESYLNDTLPNDIHKKYDNIRIIKFNNNINEYFEDIDICVNNLWICTDIIKHIKYEFPNLTLITVCHSLIIMENLTNLGSIYTNNYNQQEETFKISDIIILISKSEEKYYKKYNYDKLNPNTYVIYNSYTPKYDNHILDINYDSNIIGYIGRHVPRKRPELLIKAVSELKLKNIKVHNFGIDTDKYHNDYWYYLKDKYKNILKITNFTSDKNLIENYWETIGCNCITGIYEPFGFTICEALDRRMALVVSNIDGPSEIIDSVKEYVTLYEVDYDYEIDKKNFNNALLKFLKLSPQEKKQNAFKARKCLNRFRPERIIIDWNILFYKILTKNINLK